MTTTDTDICLLSLEDVAAQIAAKRISPLEVTGAVLARIERLQPKLNAYITVTAEQAMDEARAAEREIAAGNYRGPLHGVPVAHKDLFDTKGVRTTAGAKVFADRVPDADAAIVERMRDAGAIMLGKLGMHECAYGTTSDNIHFGAIRNPWNTDHVPGGSSGGSGAAAAAGLAYAATGSDTGGSIRMPAAVCGCVGLMPTYGRVSLRGAVPLSCSLDHAGPLTRTVRDAAIVLQATAGHDPRDPVSVDMQVPDYLEGVERGPRGLRIGVPKQFFWDSLEPDIEALVRKAISDLEGAGAEVREVEFAAVDAYRNATGTVMIAEAAAFHAPTFPSRRDEYSPRVAFLLDLGLRVTGVQLASAMKVLQEARAGGADDVLGGVDVLAVPTMPCAAPSIEASRQHDPSGRMGAFTMAFDLTGQPAISVPCGLTPAGLPAGLMLVARQWDEVTLLRAARGYELVRGDFPAPPV